MNEFQAGLVAALVSQYLNIWQDRQAPFQKDRFQDPDVGRPHEREACAAFQDQVVNALNTVGGLHGTLPDDREGFAYLCLMCPDAPGVVPPLVLLDELIRVLRCAFPDETLRLRMIPGFVIAYGCGNWRPGAAPWPDAQAALSRMVGSALRGAERWIQHHVYGAQQYANNQAVLAAATAEHKKPLAIKNTLPFVQALLGDRLELSVVAGDSLEVVWAGQQVSIPELGTVLRPGAKRAFSCLTQLHIETAGRALDFAQGSTLVIAARERGFDLGLPRPNGKVDGVNQCKGSVRLLGPATLEYANCNCAKDACAHRHTLAAWSPRSFDRLTFNHGAARIASLNWDGVQLVVSGVAHFSTPITTFPLHVAFSGIVNQTPKLVHGNQEYQLRKHDRIHIQKQGSALSLHIGGVHAEILPGHTVKLLFGNDKQANPSAALWRCTCGHHRTDPWTVPPMAKGEAINAAPVDLASFIATALNGPSYPIAHKSFATGMFLAVATDLGFDLDGRVHSASIVQSECANPGCAPFEGGTCNTCNAAYNPNLSKHVKVEGRIILIETTLEMRPPNFVIQMPAPYPSCDEFVRCGQCHNYYQIIVNSFAGRAVPGCGHVLAQQPLADRLAEAGSNGPDLAAARVWEQLRAETNRCGSCPPGRVPIGPVPWCPLPHELPIHEPVLANGTTVLWVRR